MEALSLFLLWLLFGCDRSGGGASPPLLPSLPGGQPGWPGSPISYTPPWPQAPASGLPPFPGSGWEFDEPPPPAVQQRARQLVDSLWARGNGAHVIEQTGGRWIAYRAEVVASGRKGVVAFRLKTQRALPAAPQQTALRRAAPGRAAPAARQPIPSPPAASSSSSRPSPPAAAKPVAYNVQVGPAQNIRASQPPVSPVSPVSLPVLQRGAGIKPKPPSPNVKILQQRLGIVDDGRFGKGTEDAVIAYQRSHGLEDDGIVGPKTWAKLFEGNRA